MVPHDVCGSTILLLGDVLYACTSNGIGPRHRVVPRPDAPTLIALEKTTGRLLATDGEKIGRRMLHGHWSSRMAFILAVTGSAVGLGNIWKFPYVAGQNGGGAFVLVYLVCVILVGMPVMMSEILIGRRGRRNPVATMALLGEPVDPHDWEMPPHAVNAYYHPLRNEIVFPAGILQPPFYVPDGDDAVNYGAIGAVIGHEIGHGFDDKGSTFDGDGAMKNWWTEEDRAEFERRTRDLVEQYNAYAPFDDLSVNGEFTLGENIGDLGGISIGLLAYEMSLNGEEPPVIDGFTGVQRVFLGYGQIWRNKYRDEALRQLIMTNPHSPKYRTFVLYPKTL